MTPFEIFLVIIGLVIVVLSYVISEKVTDKNKENQVNNVNEIEEARQTQIDKVNEEDIKKIRSRMNEVFLEMVDDSVEKTDSELSTICNEKIIAVSEYSDQILEKIDTNHREVLFLYSMLNDKEKEIKDTVSKIDNAKRKINEIMDSVEDMAQETERKSVEITTAYQNELNKLEDINQQRINRQIIKEEDVPITVKKTTRKISEKVGLPDEISNDTIKEFKVVNSYKELKSKNSNEQILKLHEEGKSTVEIAKLLDLGQGEVKLVIDLFRGVKR